MEERGAIRTRREIVGFILDLMVCTDEARAHIGIGRAPESVNHSAGAHVRAEARTQNVEIFRSMLERGHKGVYHKFSPKHLDRYVTEFAGRHNIRELGTEDQMVALTKGMVGKCLRWRNPIVDNGLSSGSRT